MTGRPPKWRDETIQKMIQLLNEKKSTKEIGAELGVSKGAVIGKCHRLGINIGELNGMGNWPRPRVRLHLSNVGVSNVVKFKKPKMPKLPKATPIKYTIPKEECGTCTIMELNSNTCRWPMWGDGAGPRLYCGASRMIGSPYCAKHHARGSAGPYRKTSSEPRARFVIKKRPLKAPKSSAL